MVLLRTVVDLSSYNPSLPGWMAFLPFTFAGNDKPEICNSVVKEWPSRRKRQPTGWIGWMIQWEPFVKQAAQTSER